MKLRMIIVEYLHELMWWLVKYKHTRIAVFIGGIIDVVRIKWEKA